MVDVWKSGLALAIGVSNFNWKEIADLEAATGELPEVNQIQASAQALAEELFKVLGEAYAKELKKLEAAETEVSSRGKKMAAMFEAQLASAKQLAAIQQEFLDEQKKKAVDATPEAKALFDKSAAFVTEQHAVRRAAAARSYLARVCSHSGHRACRPQPSVSQKVLPWTRRKEDTERIARRWVGTSPGHIGT